MRALFLLALFPALARPPAAQPPRIRTLLLTGGCIGSHDWRIVSPLLRKALEDTGRFDVRVTEDSAARALIENRELVCRTGAGDAVSRAKFRSAQIHVEFLVPHMAEQTGQLKGNSGVYIQKVTEIQILDGFGNPTYATGTVGAIYGQHPPLVNASRRPGEWSSYGIVYHAPVCNERGQEVRPGTLTVFLNGVLVQDNAPLRFQRTMCESGPILLQDHSGFPGAPDTTMRSRNIWYRPLD